MGVSTLHGRGGRVLLAPSPTAPAALLGQARGWRIDVKNELVENTQGFGQIWKEWLLASTGWNGTIDGNLDTAQSTPFDAANQPGAATYGAVRCYLYPDGGTTARFYAGLVWPSLSVDARLSGVIRYHLDFVGHGPLVSS